MANKKINQLGVRSPLSLTDLMLVGDPSTGYSYKTTIGDLSTFLETNIALNDLNDVTISSPANNNLLKYNGSQWVNTSFGSFLGGSVTQYVRGDGSLGDFSGSGGGGGASVSYYLNGSVNQGTIGGVTYLELNKVPVIGTGTDFVRNTNGYIASFLTDPNDPALLKIPGGNWNLEFYFSASSGGGTPTFYVELYKYDGSTFSLIASSSTTPEAITGGTVIDAYFTSLSVPETVLTLTDRLAIRVYVTTVGRTITLHTENSHLCQVITTFTTGLTALNNLTAQVQFFATGTTGTDFNISSTTATHTFNIPTASATNRGALSSADWTTFNSKQNAITLTTTGSSGAATFVSNTLNIPTYTLSGLGGVPTTRTLTINGTSFDLSADRSWTISTGPTGSGTTNYIAKWTSSTALGNSLIFDNGTNIGIGIASPTNTLHIDRGNTTASYLQFTAGTTTGQTATDGTIFGIDASGNAIINQRENLPLSIRTNDTERILVKSDGISVFSETVRIKLTKKLRFSFYDNDTATDGMEFYLSNTPLAYIDTPNIPGLLFNIGGTFVMRLTNSGRVGIGTNSPGSALDVYGVIQNGLTLRQYVLGTGVSAAAPTYSFLGDTNNGWYSPSADVQGWTVGGTDAMRLFSNGNFAVGTTTDGGQKLQVNGTIGLPSGSGAIYFNPGANTFALYKSGTDMYFNGGTGWSTFGGNTIVFTNGANTTEYARINSSGNLGIGTNAPSASSILDLTSTTKGFLPPRMTGAQAEAIATPATGLMVYANNGNGATITSTGWWGYDGTTWVKLN